MMRPSPSHFLIELGIGLGLVGLLTHPALAKPKKTTTPTEKSSSLKASASSSPKKAIPLELLEIEKKYQASKTLEADFTQNDDVKLTQTKKSSSGVLMIQHPDRFRWETLKPEKSLLVSNGKKFWFYTPPFEAGERGQVIEKKTSEVQSELANALLSASFSKVKDVEIKKVSSAVFEILPKDGVAGSLKRAEIQIASGGGLIERLLLEHQGGNRTEIRLSNIKLGGKLNEGYFSFAIPPATDVIRE